MHYLLFRGCGLDHEDIGLGRLELFKFDGQLSIALAPTLVNFHTSLQDTPVVLVNDNPSGCLLWLCPGHDDTSGTELRHVQIIWDTSREGGEFHGSAPRASARLSYESKAHSVQGACLKVFFTIANEALKDIVRR